MRVALVHDYLTQYGGAERVLDALHARYPTAPIFTSVYDPEAMPAHYRDADIRTSAMAHLPGINQYHRSLLPLYPPLFRQFSRQLQSFDAVITDSSAWSHHAHGAESAFHLCYCHSPARFLYGDEHYLDPAGLSLPVRIATPPLFSGLRALDRRAARRVDHYIANSRTVAERIRRVYSRDAQVIYPPVDIERFMAAPPANPEPYFLVLSRLVPHKRIDLVVRVCTEAGLPLKVVGTGRALPALQQQAGPTIEFLGWQSDSAVAELLRRCQAFILPGAEDFGITAVEAQAAGRPVIAFAAGGALESVRDGETGLFFQQQTPASLLDALDRFSATSWKPERMRANALRFDRQRFQDEIATVVETGVRAKQQRFARF